MIELFQQLIGRIGIFAVLFILLSKILPVHKLFRDKLSKKEKLFLAVVFGCVSIAGTYLGVPIQNAIANSRVIGVALAAILGGPIAGLAAGIIAGSHRYLMDIGGFTSVACSLATVIEGVASGLIYHSIKQRKFDIVAIFITGILVECLQMAIILAVARPFEQALELVKVIGIPMILSNSIGLLLFVQILAFLQKEQEKAATSMAQTTLKIALLTLPHLRNGLNQQTAELAVNTIIEMTNVDAVAITDTAMILAFKGIGDAHHKSGNTIPSNAARLAIASGNLVVQQKKAAIGCSFEDCPINSGVIVPLKVGENAIGTLGLFRGTENRISTLDTELAKGLGLLFGNQLELGEIETQKRQRVSAEIKALQAQINPHFLYNALSTIGSCSRTDPSLARELLVKLADFFRNNTCYGDKFVALSAEIRHCQDYLGIEKARFEDRIVISYEIDPEALGCNIPPLIIQPLVENALHHGILLKEKGGSITIGAQRKGDSLHIFVRDDGVGMDEGALDAACGNCSVQVTPALSSSSGPGIALRNIRMRLMAIYGADNTLQVESRPGHGTTVSFKVPVSA